MGGDNVVLVVLDGPEVQREAMRHALELAERLGCAPVALLLPGGAPAEPCPREHPALAEASLIAREQGVELRTHVRYGDRASELLKHLAENGSVRTVVWGGDPHVLTSRRFRGGGHWLGRIRAELDCPIVTARARP